MQFQEAGIGDLNTHVFSGPQELDVTEIGLHPFMLAYGNDDFRDYSLLPIFPLRLFRHKSIFIRTDRGIKKPEDLRGKKVAIPDPVIRCKGIKKTDSQLLRIQIS
jgi:4,5-dihydroxyphthalate decarboxylase